MKTEAQVQLTVDSTLIKVLQDLVNCWSWVASPDDSCICLSHANEQQLADGFGTITMGLTHRAALVLEQVDNPLFLNVFYLVS